MRHFSELKENEFIDKYGNVVKIEVVDGDIRFSGDVEVKPKKIDMSKFAGSDVLLSRENKYFFAHKNCTTWLVSGDVSVVYGYWNHWTGDKEPKWLEGFEYVTMQWFPLAGKFEEVSGFNCSSWDFVCAIKITGIKAGWEL